jgi:D-serine deaminase-like pyridoxal phosphate-dependent protein
MKEEFTFYVGVDWGVEFHQACILDARGEKMCQRRIEHSGPGMLEFCDFLKALTNGEASALAVAIEVPRGPIVEALLEHTLALDCREGILTEHQAGSYIFMDVEYGAVTLRANDADAAFATSLFLHSTAISKNVPGRVTIDAGLKSFATDGPLPRVSAGAPVGTTYSFFGDEHGCLTFPTPTDCLPLGSIVAFVTPHCDPTINLHDYLHVVRHDTIVDIWQIVGRGVL